MEGCVIVSVLINKKYKSYDRTSRYQVFPTYHHTIDEKRVYGLTSHLVTEDIKFIAHKVKNNDTLDSLALYYYNNPTYYWIIADFNRIRDPYEPLELGTILKIPTFSNIAFDI